jgi:DNA polymerase-3 subunit alpha
MRSASFVHLRLHSEFSISDGIVRLDAEVNSIDAEGQVQRRHVCPPVEAACADHMPALALTDLMNLFGAVRFQQAALSRGVQPITGCDVRLSNDRQPDQPARVLLLVRNATGYNQLCTLLTRAYAENLHRGHAELRREWLNAEATTGLLVLSGAEGGDIGQALATGSRDRALERARAWQRDCGDRFYIELQRVQGERHERYIEAALGIAAELDLPVVATHPIQFMQAADWNAHETKVCIAQGYTLADPSRPRLYSPQQYFKTQAEMASLFHDLPEALANTLEVARRCAFVFPLGEVRLPGFPTPAGQSADEYLYALSAAGLEERLAVLFDDPTARAEAAPRYRERLEFELRTIQKMGFAGYFLIVQDFINWAKRNGIPVGPGRGSGAGSLAAYALRVTDLDPIRYELLFERFLNPERKSMPDFDIDFSPEGRDRVIQYVKQKYGADAVSQIATFGTMAAKAALRDVGRVMDWGFNRTDELAKLIPFQPGKQITLAEAREMEPRLKLRAEAEEDTAELLAMAEQVEGLTRNVGMHAGGVLIAPGKLTDFTPLYRQEGADAFVSQFDKDDIEKIGLVKFDFLGLTTLTIIDHAVGHIRAMRLREGDDRFDIDRIPLDDAASYQVFQKAETTAVFQFESGGMRDLLKRARPDRLEDLIALNALYRPGPMDLIPEFVSRKHGGERWAYLDPRMAPILDPTYGIMVYQEQVMQVAQVIGGYSLGGADLLRRAMGKKKPEEMAAQQNTFVRGAGERGMAEDKARELFALMEKFAGYGFNKSHSAAYAWVAYQTAFLKAHYPAAFYAANLSAVMDETDKAKPLLDDAAARGIKVLLPDINTGTYRFHPVAADTVRYGLGAIKGTGEAAIDAISDARGTRPFRDLADFCRRVDRRLVNRRAMEALIRAGAMDGLDPNRAALLARLQPALDLAEKSERDFAQVSLFGGDDRDLSEAALKRVGATPWSTRERLANEKVALGFYLSGHPFAACRDELRRVARTPLAEVQRGKEAVHLAGVIDSVIYRNSKRGRIAVVTLDDATAKLEVVIFGELLESCRPLLQEDAPLVVEGRVSVDDFSQGLRVTADRVQGIDDLRGNLARALTLRINGEADPRRLRQLLAPFIPGPCAVAVDYTSAHGSARVLLGPDHRVRITDHLVRSLTDWLDEGNVHVHY